MNKPQTPEDLKKLMADALLDSQLVLAVMQNIIGAIPDRYLAQQLVEQVFDGIEQEMLNSHRQSDRMVFDAVRERIQKMRAAFGCQPSPSPNPPKKTKLRLVVSQYEEDEKGS